jgi:hypothetical protein
MHVFATSTAEEFLILGKVAGVVDEAKLTLKQSWKERKRVS